MRLRGHAGQQPREDLVQPLALLVGVDLHVPYRDCVATGRRLPNWVGQLHSPEP